MSEQFVDQGELEKIKAKLDLVTVDLIERLSIAATDPWVRLGISGPHVQSQPCSRPPYNMNAGAALDELQNELGTTIRHICEHRAIEIPDVSTLVAAAGWLRKHHIAIALMEDGEEICRKICRAVDMASMLVNTEEQEYRIPLAREREMVAHANQFEVDAAAVERMAFKLGDQAKGLNRDRVDYLRRKGYLGSHREVDEETGEETGKHWYYLGDVLSAHKRAREERGLRHAESG